MSTVTTLINFQGTSFGDPISPLIADSAGNLFGEVFSSSSQGAGAVFELQKTPNGYATAVTPLAIFSEPDGSLPLGGLVEDSNGNLFGTTSELGSGGGIGGTVFEIVKTGNGYASAPTTLVTFNGTNGSDPYASLVTDAAGDLFGTTSGGGLNNDGTVFEIKSGVFTTLANFDGSNGAGPTTLDVDSAGNLYGTAKFGGLNNDGTVFEIQKTGNSYAGSPTTLISFDGTDGATPASLVLDAAGDLIGTTIGYEGTTPVTPATVFEVSKTDGVFANAPTTLATFVTISGLNEFGLLTAPTVMIDSAGNLYGTALLDADGTVFFGVYGIGKTSGGYSSTVTEVAGFDGSNGNFIPSASLLVDGAGNLLGTTTGGIQWGFTVEGQENNDIGSVFEVSGFPPFDRAPTVTTSGGIVQETAPVAAVVDAAVAVADADNTTLASATVSVTGGFQSGQDVLAFTNNGSTMGNIVGSYGADTGVLTLTSSGATATVAQWQAALEVVTYADTSGTPNTVNRTIGFAVNDGTLGSNSTTKTVNVIAPPAITVQTAGGIDLRWATIYDELANSPISTGGTATQYTATDSGAFNGHSAAIEFVVTGSGFTYSGSSPNMQLTGGTIASIQEQDASNTVLATFTGLSIGATTFQSAINTYTSGGSATPSALNTIFLALKYLVTGGAGSDKLQGGNLDDTIICSAGNDTVDGGAGSNTADYSSLTTPGLFAIIQGGGGTVNKGGANGTDTLTNAQYLTDTGTGRGNGDVFEIDSGEHVTATSANFNYLIELSAGVNLAYGINFTGISEFVSNVGTNTLDFSNDQNFAYVFGSVGNDTLTLGSGGGYLIGEGGTNVLTGGANATNLFVGGQGGTDTMNGGTGTASNYYFVDGNDQVNGAGGFNAMIELVSGVTVQLGSAQYAHVQEFVSNTGTNVVTVANTDTDFTFQYGNTGNDTLSTGSGGGYLIGEGGTNVLTGGGGLNVFVADGGAGADTMNGGSGSNVYLIDANSIVNGAGTFNTVEELQQNATLVLGSAQLGSDVQQVVLNSGTNSADFHTATSSVFLYGGANNDTLFGGTGNDFLYGGTGTNTFKFASGWGQDTIEDWTAGTNSVIDLTGLASQGVHATTDLTQIITGGNDVITSTHTGTNSITLLGVGSALTAGSFHFA